MWPTISNISGNIANTIKSYANDNLAASGLNAWVRVYSGAKSDKGSGLILESNTDFKIFSAAGESAGSIYGNAERSGAVGRTWDNVAVVSDVGRVLRPSPIITTLNSKEGQDQISRTCDFSITCFTLQQLELMQTYFMEPGYSVAVEWGWNTDNSAKGLINTGDVTSTLNQIADVTLNNGQLSSKRLFTNGEYDIFLGFIIGSTISSDGENFKIDVKLRGAPSLPTYMQSQNRITIKPTDPTNVSPDPDKSKALYPESELISEGNIEEEAKKRRFKYMFNELPAFRQTENVKKLIDKAKAIDFMNFDRVIQTKIDEYLASVAVDPDEEEDAAAGTEITPTVTLSGEDAAYDVPREKVFSTNRYIRFGLAIDILNQVGTVDKYEIGGKSVSFTINIENTIIGAFPLMFSTKKTKLIIPGLVPDFRSTYFISSDEIVQQRNGLINGANPVASAGFVFFVENKPLNDFGLKEKAKYYGYLKNLYVNFDMFKAKLEQKNKNVREILEDILNEMSSAVNSFWNFQIVEGELKKTAEGIAADFRRRAPGVAAPARGFNPTGGQYTPGVGFGNFNGNVTGGGGVGGTTTTTPIGGNNTTANASFISTAAENDIVITVVDENWIGENPDPGGVVSFNHSGVGSPFLNATLDISIPAEMGAKIINTRLGAVSQTDVRDVRITASTLFNSETDLFLTKVSPPTSGSDEDTNVDLNEDEQTTANIALIAAEEAKITRSETEEVEESTLVGGVSGVKFVDVEKFYDNDGNLIKIVRDGVVDRYTNLNLTQAQISAAASQETQIKVDRVTTNLEKIDVIVKPTVYAIPELAFETEEGTKGGVRAYFMVYCLDDTDFFEQLKTYWFEAKGTGALSQPLPIKYSFTILGNSGIRRGDTFKIDGIPRKYAEKGIFQVTGIEHSLSGIKWETTVEALYRQIE